MGWKVPGVSSAGTSFNADFGLSTDAGETFGLSTFLRDSDAVYHTYFTTDRALEAVDTRISPCSTGCRSGRQKSWEGSPPGWPALEPYVWWHRHDEY